MNRIIGGSVLAIAATITTGAVIVHGAGEASALPARCTAISATPAVTGSKMCNPDAPSSGAGNPEMVDRTVTWTTLDKNPDTGKWEFNPHSLTVHEPKGNTLGGH